MLIPFVSLDLDHVLILLFQFIAQVVTEKRPLDTVAVGALARVFETVGLSLFLTWYAFSEPRKRDYTD